MMLSVFGRDRVAVLLKDQVNMERPSDIQGLICIPFKDELKEAALALAKEIKAKGISIDTTRVAVVHFEAVVSTLLKVAVKGSGGIVPAITLIDPDEVVEATGSGNVKGKFKGEFTLAKTGNYTLEIDRDPSSTSSSGAVKYKVSGKAPKSKQLVPEP